jgi:hypothetical protein
MSNVHNRVKDIFTETKTDKKSKINKKFIYELWDKTKVYLVDGDRVRNDKNVEFIGGGNAPADTDPKNPTDGDCPKGEIWIERMKDPTEQIFILVHEITEYIKMKYHKGTYDNSHPIANSVENAIRHMAKEIGIVK